MKILSSFYRSMFSLYCSLQ